ncbi:hypothetical protein Hanom_Chr17g01565391 [Helianthus anomalus]
MYDLINILDDSVVGEMTVKVLPDNELPWLDSIRDFFHHRMEESLNTFTHTRTCVHPSTLVNPKTIVTPFGEEITILSSEEFVTSSCERLIRRPCSTRAGAGGEQLGGLVIALRETKCKLDVEATLKVSVKKWRLLKHVDGCSPSEREIDLSVLQTKKLRSKLDAMFTASVQKSTPGYAGGQGGSS